MAITFQKFLKPNYVNIKWKLNGQPNQGAQEK
jgi:hypothetical protein